MDGDDNDLLLLPHLPEHILTKIMVSLPVISLLRFKCVCKSWRALIQSSFFIDLHITTTSNSSSCSKFGNFILHTIVGGPHPVDDILEDAIIMLSSGCGFQFEYNSSFEFANSDNYVFDHSRSHNHELVYKLDNLGIPSPYRFVVSIKYIIAGSCNGLICLYHKDFSFWNPATKQYRILPKSISNFEEERIAFRLVGFGFDLETKDYKVVLVTCYINQEYEGLVYPQEYQGLVYPEEYEGLVYPEEYQGLIYPEEYQGLVYPEEYQGLAYPEEYEGLAYPEESEGLAYPCEVQVYNLSTDSWRILEDINSFPGCPDFGFDLPNVLEGFYLNGSSYFMASDLNSSKLIISFDFNKEIFVSMHLPNHQRVEQNLEFTLTCLGEKLALFSKYTCYDDYVGDEFYYDRMGDFREVKYLHFEIWVLNNYQLGRGENKDWRKLHSFQIQMPTAMDWIPRGISNNGEFMLFQFEEFGESEVIKKMKLYNLVTGEAEIDFLCGSTVMSRADVYNPSLVSITSVGGKEA